MFELSAVWAAAQPYVVGALGAAGLTTAAFVKAARGHFTKTHLAEDNLSCAERHTKTHKALVDVMKKYDGKLAQISFSNDEQLEVIRSNGGTLESASANMNDRISRVNVNKASYYLTEPHKHFDIVSHVDKYPATEAELKAIKKFSVGSWQDNSNRRLFDRISGKAELNNRKILERGTQDAIEKISALMDDPRDNVAIGGTSTLAIKFTIDGKAYIKVSALNEMQTEKMSQLYGAKRNDPYAYIDCLIAVNEENGIIKPEVSDDVPKARIEPIMPQSDADRFPTLVSKEFQFQPKN